MRYLVIDVGGTAIKYALLDENANYSEIQETPTPMDSLESYLTVLDSIIHRNKHNIDGIAMCVPGIIDSAKGVCVTGGNLRYVKNLPLVAILEAKYGLRVSLENDARCAALAELWKGNLKNCKVGVEMELGCAVAGAVDVAVLLGNAHRIVVPGVGLHIAVRNACLLREVKRTVDITHELRTSDLALRLVLAGGRTRIDDALIIQIFDKVFAPVSVQIGGKRCRYHRCQHRRTQESR